MEMNREYGSKEFKYENHLSLHYCDCHLVFQGLDLTSSCFLKFQPEILQRNSHMFF